MVTYIKQSTTHFLVVVLLDNKGDYKTGETITYEVRKSSDNSLTTSGTLTSTGNIYTDTISILVLGEYYVLYFTPTKHENGLEHLIVQQSDINDIDDSLTTLAVNLATVLGLVQHNMRYTDHVYNGDGCLTSAKLKLYNNKSDTDTDINAFATYTITATYDTEAKLTGYKVTED